MKTIKDFQDRIAAKISDYPVAAQLYRARDPRLMASLDAMAAMMALLSEEQDVAAAEPFTKARDMTVLADASAKGVLPFGKSAKCELSVTNGNSSPFSLATGRTIQDRQGRRYVVESGVVVGPNSAASVVVNQYTQRSFSHTVTVSQPFYMLEVPKPENGASIAAVQVEDSLGNEFEYRAEFVNVEPGLRCFHLVSDEQQRLYIEFGADSLAGYQPSAGEIFAVTITDTEGEFTLAAGSKFAFEYTGSPLETQVALTLTAVLSPGAAPMSVNAMREISTYPSLYNTSAVYLGNFDFLIRRNLGPFRFLSIWNEWKEEQVRGANVNNINTLFVTALKDGVAEATLNQQIYDAIKAADDSYKISHVAVDEVEIPVTVRAKVAGVYDFDMVRNQIRELVLGDYGRDSDFSKSGQSRVLYKRIYRLLEANVPALQGNRSDLEVEVTDPDEDILPEQYRYVSEASLNIVVEQYL